MKFGVQDIVWEVPLPNLAAYDIAKAIEAAGLRAHLACYTFGSPRTGNHAFAVDYRQKVPDTWSVINDQVRMVVQSKQTLAANRPTALRFAG